MRRSVTDCRRGMANFASTSGSGLTAGRDSRERSRCWVRAAMLETLEEDMYSLAGLQISAEAVHRAASLTGDHLAVDRLTRRLRRLALLGCRSPRGILPPVRRMRLPATRPRVVVAQVDSPGR